MPYLAPQAKVHGWGARIAEFGRQLASVYSLIFSFLSVSLVTFHDEKLKIDNRYPNQARFLGLYRAFLQYWLWIFHKVFNGIINFMYIKECCSF